MTLYTLIENNFTSIPIWALYQLTQIQRRHTFQAVQLQPQYKETGRQNRYKQFYP